MKRLCLMLMSAPLIACGVVAPQEPESHREVAMMCDDVREPSLTMADPNQQVGGGECGSDADCTDGDNGRCIQGRGQFCTYDTCYADSDCGTGVCECGQGVGNNHCVSQGNCQVDTDCSGGQFCSPSLGSCGPYGGVVGYFCHTPEDECVNDSDCTGSSPDAHCSFNEESDRWTCSTAFCVG